MRVVEIEVPGCKSASQRALILAALAAGESHLRGLSSGEDSTYLIDALRRLGWTLEAQDGGLKVQGSGGPRTAGVEQVELGEGGSTLRFLMPVLAAAPQDLEIRVAEGLRRRPQAALVEVLDRLGATVTPTERGFHLRSTPRDPGQAVEVPVDLSSQFLSGFLMAAGAHPMLWCPKGDLVSRGYLAMTVRMMRKFRGPAVLEDQGRIWSQAAGFGIGQELQIPADASAIVFFAVAAILQQVRIRITRAWDPHHPDVAVLQFLDKHGLLKVDGQDLVPDKPLSSLVGRSAPAFDLQESPDSGPALAVLAAAMPHGIAFLNPERLQFKESDRIAGMQELDRFCRHPQARDFHPRNDHRLAMAAGIATLGYPQATILQPECVAKSFPGFWEQLARLHR